MKFDKSVSKISHILTFPLISMSVPMKFHLSKMKTEGLVRKSLRSVKTLKNYKFLAKIGPKKQKFKIPLPKPHAGSAKECSYEVSSL